MTDASCGSFNDETTRAAPSANVVNYVWINKEEFIPGDEPDEPQCGIPLENVDMVIQNAQQYPDADFNIWVDAKYLEHSPTLEILQRHLTGSGCTNIKVRDLNTDLDPSIINYTESPYFFPDSGIPVWHRVDVARFLVTQQSLLEHPDKTAIYADFDVDDVQIESEKFRRLLDTNGFVLGATVEEGKMDYPENGYFAFRNRDDANALLESIMHKTYSETAKGVQLERNDVFNAYFASVMDHYKENGMTLNRETLLHTLQPTEYRIPRNPKYAGLSI